MYSFVVGDILMRGERLLSRIVFKVSLGFLAGALILLALSLYASSYYLEEQGRLSAAGDLEGAVEKTRSAARLDPFNPEPLQTQALLLQQLGQIEEAEATLREAANRDPNNYVPYLFLGNLQLFSTNDAEASIESYRDVLRLNPNATIARLALAEALVRSGELEKAGREYEILREAQKITPQGVYDLGRIYVRTGEPGKGARTIEAAQRQVERDLEGAKGAEREQTLAYLRSMELAKADALVVQRRYVAAAEIIAGSKARQAPAILELLNTDPAGYRESVKSSDIY